MKSTRTHALPESNGIRALIVLAASLVALHLLTNGRYGFHRDELATLDDARHLAWGYVAYPPITPFLGRIQLALFGDSVWGVRVLPALAQAGVVTLTGFMARELGGNRLAQILAALATAISPVSLTAGVLLQYVTFDYLWWALTAYLVSRLLRREDPRLWPAIGASIGLGMMTKYTMAFLVAGIVAGLLLTDARRYLKSGWLWLGVAISVLIFLPNLLWQVHNHFISLEFLQHIHARDIRWGRTKNFLPEQLYVPANLFTIPLWVAGLYFYFGKPEGKPFRMMGWMFVAPFVMFVIAKGRSYYMAPAYAMPLAAGAVVEERWLASMRSGRKQRWRAATFAALAIGGLLAIVITVPLTPVNSAVFKRVIALNYDFREQLGWPELAAEAARIRDTLPPAERNSVAILGANYGEAGAIDMYGGAYGLPRAISGINSYWVRGYGDPPPETLIVIGLSRKYVNELFESCELAGHTGNPYGVANEESLDHPDIFVCRRLRDPWPEFWKDFRYFG